MRTDPRPPLPARLRPAHWFALDVLAALPMALVTYSLAARCSRRTGLGALAVVVLLIAAAGPVFTGQWSWPRPAVLLPGLAVIVGWVVGRMAAQARAYRESLRRQRE